MLTPTKKVEDEPRAQPEEQLDMIIDCVRTMFPHISKQEVFKAAKKTYDFIPRGLEMYNSDVKKAIKSHLVRIDRRPNARPQQGSLGPTAASAPQQPRPHSSLGPTAARPHSSLAPSSLACTAYTARQPKGRSRQPQGLTASPTPTPSTPNPSPNQPATPTASTHLFAQAENPPAPDVVMPDDQLMLMYKLVVKLESNPVRSGLVAEIFAKHTKTLLGEKAETRLQVRPYSSVVSIEGTDAPAQ